MNDKLLVDIRAAIHEADPDLDYRILAEVIAKVLILDYGTHNYTRFIQQLKYELNK